VRPRVDASGATGAPGVGAPGGRRSVGSTRQTPGGESVGKQVMGPIARYFKFAERGTNIATESRAGLTTFMVRPTSSS